MLHLLHIIIHIIKAITKQAQNNQSEPQLDRSGCIMRLKLVNNSLPGSDLIVDAYITNNNIKADKIQKGMLVYGNLWFQGEIAG